jgi:sigma-B regulation protein RsbU (phosphoserine phosphatase)
VAELAADLNRLMHTATGDGRFITLFYALYDRISHTLTYVNAGHNPPLLVRSRDFQRLETGGPVIGPLVDTVYCQETIQLFRDDILVLFTDGITEATSTNGEEFGEERLRSLVCDSIAMPAQALRDRILAEVEMFAGRYPDDDRTLIVAKVL